MTLQGFEVRAAKPKGERASDDEPVQQPIRAAEKSPADRRNLTNDERTVKRRRRRVHAAFSGPGYYLVDKDAAPQSGRYDTMSEAEADIEPESGHLVQYLDQAPNSSHIAEPFPANLNQVNGSLSMSARIDDEFAFEAAMTEGDTEWGDEDKENDQAQKTAALPDERISDAYERHIRWAAENGHDPDTVKGLRAHELAKGITRAEANGIADLQGIGGGDTNWRSQGYRDEPWTQASRHTAGTHPADIPAKDYWPENPDDPWTDPEGKAIREQKERERKEGSLHHSEAELLTAMAKATGPEQQRLMGELEGLRRQARRQAMADREIDLADAYIHAAMTPVRVHEHHTAATDWIEDVAEPDLGAPAVHRAVVVEAQHWAKRVSAAVKEDQEEYLEQARGVARLLASSMGPYRDMAFQIFMKVAQDEQDQNAPASMVAPWGAPPMTLPPVGGGDAPFGMPTGGGPLNGQNFNPMATEVYPGSQVLPLDNGASVWPPADNLEGEAPLPPVAPDNYNAVGAETHMSSRRTADARGKGYSPRSGMGGKDQGGPWRATHTFNPIGWDAFDARPHPGSKAITPGVPVMNHGYMSPRGPGGMRLVHISDEAGNHQTVDSRSLGGLSQFDRDQEARNRGVPTDAEMGDDFDREQDQDILERNEERRQPYEWDPRRREGSQAFNGPKQTYTEYQARLAEGSTPMDEEHFAGSMAAVSPSTSNTTIPVTGMIRWAERGFTNPDPQGKDLAGNPMAGYPEGGDWDKDEAHAQSGEAQSSLPLAPEGDKVTQHLDWITDFPDTGPAEVPSDRAFNIDANAGEDMDAAARNRKFRESLGASRMTEAPSGFDPGYEDETREINNPDWDTTDYMSEIPHDFESSGNSQYCRHCGESRRHPMHVYARRIAAEKPFDPDRSGYSMAPVGDAQATADYEQAYSSDRPIDYTVTGIGELGTVPVQGYGANPSGEMFNWQIGPPGPHGAADVAAVPTPGAGTQGAPQPTDLGSPELPEGKEARLRAIRSRVRRSLGNQPLRNQENQWSNPSYSLGDDDQDGSDSND